MTALAVRPLRIAPGVREQVIANMTARPESPTRVAWREAMRLDAVIAFGTAELEWHAVSQRWIPRGDRPACTAGISVCDGSCTKRSG